VNAFLILISKVEHAPAYSLVSASFAFCFLVVLNVTHLCIVSSQVIVTDIKHLGLTEITLEHLVLSQAPSRPFPLRMTTFTTCSVTGWQLAGGTLKCPGLHNILPAAALMRWLKWCPYRSVAYSPPSFALCLAWFGCIARLLCGGSSNRYCCLGFQVDRWRSLKDLLCGGFSIAWLQEHNYNIVWLAIF
jgi:hypothetical protein